MLKADTQDGPSLGVRAVAFGTAIVAALLFATVPAAAAGDPLQTSQLKNQMETVGRFISIVIAFVAIPNGAYGVFQYMTAGTDTEQSEKGRKRIRNSFVGVAGAGAIIVAVRLLTSMLGVTSGGSGSNPDLQPALDAAGSVLAHVADVQLALLNVVPAL